MLEKGVEGKAEGGGGDADERHEVIFGFTPCEEAEGEETEQRAVGVADEDVDSSMREVELA